MAWLDLEAKVSFIYFIYLFIYLEALIKHTEKCSTIQEITKYYKTLKKKGEIDKGLANGRANPVKLKDNCRLRSTSHQINAVNRITICFFTSHIRVT